MFTRTPIKTRRSIIMRRTLQILALTIISCVCFARVTSFPPKASQLYGTWVGFSEEANNFYRLTLRDGQGTFAFSEAISSNSASCKIYHVDRWSVDAKGQLAMKATGLQTNYEPIALSGNAYTYMIKFALGRRGGGWQRAGILHREEVVERGLQNLKRFMEGETNAGPKL
jgi:hypothetical protein